MSHLWEFVRSKDFGPIFCIGGLNRPVVLPSVAHGPANRTMTMDNSPESLPPFGEYVSLKSVADRYGIKTERLKKQAERGDFPEIIKISTKDYRVRLADVVAWEKTRWVGPSGRVTDPEETPPSLRRRKRTKKKVRQRKKKKAHQIRKRRRAG